MKTGLIVIAGVGKDLGISIANIFGMKGYDIVLLGRDTRKIKSQTQVLKDTGISFHIIEIDVTDSNSVDRAFSKIHEINKPIDCMIYNAVLRSFKKPSELNADEVIDDLKVNIGGAIACTNKVLGSFRKQNYGSIIFTGGGVALRPSTGLSSMSIGKAALRNYAINLQNELKDSNLFVGIVTITDYIKSGTDYSPDIIADLYYKMFSEKNETEIII